MMNPLLNKLKKLIVLLIISCSFNILAIALLIYVYFIERPPSPICERKPQEIENTAITFDNNDLINFFVALPYEELLPYLRTNTLVENGYTIRDLALGCLITFYDLDIEKIFPGKVNFQRKIYNYKDRKGNIQELQLYNNFRNEHFQDIINFIQTEKWPFTTKGLFKRLKLSTDADNSLKYAFFITTEFISVEFLFKRTGLIIEKESILDLLLDGTWEMLYNFSEKQRTIQDLSDSARRAFLLPYIEFGSVKAATLFIILDSKYALKKLNDPMLVKLLKLAQERIPETAKFAIEALMSQRCDSVCIEAAHRLYEFVGEKKPLQLDKNIAMSRFLPLTLQKNTILHNDLERELTPKQSLSKPLPKFNINKPNWKRAYTVLEGDSLWKISRMFKVDVEELKKQNNLKTDFLQPGTIIMVP